MNGPWKDEEELLECMLYWQKKALETVKWLDEMEIERNYYKQQFLDKQKELQEVIEYFMIQLGRKEVAIRYLKDEL